MCLFYPIAVYGEKGWEPPGHNPSRFNDVYDVRASEWYGEQVGAQDYILDGTPGLNMTLTPLKRYFLPSFGLGGDHMTYTKGASGEDLPVDALDEGTLYYVSTYSQPDTLPLNRFFSLASWDHMESNEQIATDGYTFEGLLGYPFASAGEGMTPIMRWFNPSLTDHLVAFHEEITSGYVEEGPLGYGYPRFGENDEPVNPHHPVPLQLTQDGVTLKCDLVWGGMIYELWWNQQQFVDHNDCGRGIQTALFKPELTDLQFGPTEAGDRKYHGSPVAESYVEGNTLYTRSIPLQWNPEPYLLDPNDPFKDHRPVLYGGEFEREARFLSLPDHRIIQYKVGYRPAESDDHMPEWVTAYLNLHVSQRFFTVTPEGNLEEIPMPSSGNWVIRDSSRGAVVASTEDGSHAFGLMTTSSASLLWWNFEEENTRKLTIWEPSKYMEAGTWYHRTFFLLVGTLKEVHESAVLLFNLAVPTLVSPSDGFSTNSSSVTLDWTSGGGESWPIEVTKDGSSYYTGTITGISQHTLDSLQPGQYEWRVAAAKPGYTPTDWSSWWKFSVKIYYVNKPPPSDCGGHTPCYSTIQDAINSAEAGSVILIAQGTYTELINLSKSKSLTLKGGYDSTYSQQTANTTFIEAPGPTTIKASSGSLKFQMITVK